MVVDENCLPFLAITLAKKVSKSQALSLHKDCSRYLLQHNQAIMLNTFLPHSVEWSQKLSWLCQFRGLNFFHMLQASLDLDNGYLIGLWTQFSRLMAFMWWCYGFLSIWRVDPSARQPCLHRMATMPTCPVSVLGMHSWLKRTPPPAWIFRSVSSCQTPWHFFCDKCQGSSPLLPQSKCLK